MIQESDQIFNKKEKKKLFEIYNKYKMTIL